MDQVSKGNENQGKGRGLEAGRLRLHYWIWLQIGNTKLRVLNIPLDIQAKFLALARFNTKNNVETCGILSGKLVCAHTHRRLS